MYNGSDNKDPIYYESIAWFYYLEIYNKLSLFYMKKAKNYVIKIRNLLYTLLCRHPKNWDIFGERFS